ncbi:hypothetical protein GF420_05535 [candidate division GN15 bacterium]|nr:hypothetical protein [candidate division GN15 bacterium]
MIFTRRTTFLLLGGTLLLAALVVLLQFTSTCQLEAVTLDGDPVADWEARLGLHQGTSVVRQPLDSLARAMLAWEDVRRVDIGYRLPGTITIRTNQFDPVCFVLSEKTGKVYGLDGDAHVIRIAEDWDDWEHPVLVNAGVREMFEPCGDVRVAMVLDQLRRLQEDHADLYRLIAEIDFTAADHLVVNVAGLPCRLWITAGQLHAQLERFVRFMYNFSPGLDSVRVIDMRFDNQIVCSVKDR